jgi:hypothetical protein
MFASFMSAIFDLLALRTAKGNEQKEGMCHSICAAAMSAQTRRVAQTFE